MASTYSTSLRLELMATGDQSGTWGDTTNTNLGTLLEQAITGYLSVAQGDVANLTLTALNGASDQSRNMVLNLTGAMTAARNVVVPTAKKIYLVVNSTTGGFAITVKTAAGTGVAVPAGSSRWVYCDATNVLDGLLGYYAAGGTDVAIADGGTGQSTVITAFDALAAKGTDVATATTLVLSTVTGPLIDLTGTTTVVAVTLLDRQVRIARAAGDFQITVGATLIGNGGPGINVAVKTGDLIIFEGYAAGVVRFWVTRASGQAMVPYDTRNLWVNGSFEVSQENGNTLGTTTGYYPADQVALFFTASTAAMSVQRVQVRSLANATNQVEFKTTTAKASLGATDFVTMTQNIEGSAIAAAGFGTAAAIPIVMRLQETLPAGAYHVHCTNSAANRHVAIPFTATGSAEVKTIVIPADTTGTWLTTDGVIGMTIDIVLAAGATLTGGTASTWSGSTFLAASTQFNILSSTANVARIADVGVKLDPAATGVYGAYRVAEVDAVYRSERYWWKLLGSNQGVIGSGRMFTTTDARVSFTFPFYPCKIPTLTFNTAVDFRLTALSAQTLTVLVAASISQYGALLNATVGVAQTVGEGVYLSFLPAGTGYVGYNARLS